MALAMTHNALGNGKILCVNHTSEILPLSTHLLASGVNHARALFWFKKRQLPSSKSISLLLELGCFT